METLERLLLPALERTPCLVAFSGGRDSSAILATATGLARSHGLDDPIPLTYRLDDHPRTWEADWQETVVRHLGLADWEKLKIGPELELLGEVGREALRRHGLYWPPNAHTMIPLLRAAGSGSLVTGNGGDELFASMVRIGFRSWLRSARSLPLRRSPGRIVLAALPHSVRVRVLVHRRVRLPWLRDAPRREVQRRIVEDALATGRNASHPLDQFCDSRYLELVREVLEAFAAEEPGRLFNPFLDPALMRAAADNRHQPFRGRGAVYFHFFGQLLPEDVTRRSTKAIFTEAFWGPESRSFARGWTGGGLDPSLVDPEELRREWTSDRPDFRSNTACQAAWLASIEI